MSVKVIGKRFEVWVFRYFRDLRFIKWGGINKGDWKVVVNVIVVKLGKNSYSLGN